MRLREVRKAKGRQQKELAEKIGTDEPMMSKFENYKCLPIPSMMRKLLKELGCRAGKRVWLTPLQKRAELMEDYLKSGFKDENDKEIKIRFLKKSA